MSQWDTKDFVNYCNWHWIPKIYAEKTFRLFWEFATSQIATRWKFSIHWFWTFKVMEFHSNLKWWKTYNKIKFIVARKVKSLINMIW